LTFETERVNIPKPKKAILSSVCTFKFCGKIIYQIQKENKMNKGYKPGTNPEDVSEGTTPMGFTSRQLVGMEELAQRSVAESEKWLLARKHDRFSSDTRQALEQLGFTIVREANDLFYEVVPPSGWIKETNGYWTTVRDAEGKERISQFYKGAIYDRDAFLNIK
jgi:hypothetical protein